MNDILQRSALGFLRHFFTFIDMKHLLRIIVCFLICNLAWGQTGGLTTEINFVKDVQCVTYNLKLSNQDSTLYFNSIRENDTLNDIPVGLYDAMFYSCDSAYRYGQRIEVIEGDIRHVYFRNNTYVHDDYKAPSMYSDDYYYGYYDSLYPPIYFGVNWQFSRGFDLDGASPDLLNNYAFDITFGHDWLLSRPVALGYEFGYGFTRATYISEDFEDPSILHEHQRFTTFDLNLAIVTSIYIKEKRFLSLGGRYRLPYYARYVRVNGNDKLTTGGLYRYNDFSVFAQLGYDWGFLFAEYRFDPIFRAPLGNLPNLSFGVRLSTRTEY